MFRNYLLTTFRSIIRQRGFSMINILGLTTGLSVSFLILFYIFSELSFDRFHYDSNRIYRLVITGTMGDMNLRVAVTPKALAGELIRSVPDIEEATLFEIETSSYLLSVGEKKIYEGDFLFADTSFLRIFNFPLLYGNPDEVLSRPYSIVVSEEFADKHFRKVDPRGQVIRLNDQQDYEVTGVFRNLPQESHLSFNFLVSLETRVSEKGTEIMDNWEELNSYTYVRLHENADMIEFQDKLDTILVSKIYHDVADVNIDLKILPQKITDIHLKSDLLGEIKENGDISYIYVLLAIVTGIILIASINFMNLSTAKSANRAKEVGIRKILGSHKSMLITQFISESVLISIVSYLLSLAVVELSLPLFNEITGKDMDIRYLSDWNLLLFFGISLLTGFLAGSYPAFYLSSFAPIEVLQNRMKLGKSGNLKLRNILVFVQFMISTGLILCTIIIYLQLEFLKTKELGFDQNSIVSIAMRNEDLRFNGSILKDEVLSIAGVKSASLSTSYPGKGLNASSYFPEGTDEKDPWLIYSFNADEDFAGKTMHMTLLTGRDFIQGFSGDSNAVLINETLQKKIGWKDPLGKKIRPSYPENGTTPVEHVVIGVVADFHFQSLHETVDPIMIHLLKEPPQLLLVRMDPDLQEETLKKIGQVWSSLNPDHPFDYEFLNDFYENFYYSEKRIGKILVYLTMFAIFIASIGLLGLSSFTAEQRTKEIGIRKVMGATSLSISLRLALEYLKMISLAGFIAWPFSYYLMQNWLTKFSYRIDMPVWPYLLATALTMILSLFVVNFQTIKAANSNPVESLRYE